MRRRPPPVPPKLDRTDRAVGSEATTIIIICEGKTEERLLKALRNHWRVPKVYVHVEGGHGDPRDVVRVASGRLRQEPAGRVEVWAVFDRDEHYHWQSAIDRARALGIELAISNPCIELWALLLHRDQTAYIDRHEAQRVLKTLHSGYDHARNPYLDVRLVLDTLDAAERRCAQLRELALADGDPHRNPSSSFGDLVSRIRVRAAA
jgi:hypothetical protein